MHCTDRPTDARTYGPTDCPQESLTTIGHCSTRVTRPKNTKLGQKWAWHKSCDLLSNFETPIISGQAEATKAKFCRPIEGKGY